MKKTLLTLLALIITAACQDFYFSPAVSSYTYHSYANAPLFRVRNLCHQNGTFFYIHDTPQAAEQETKILSTMPDVIGTESVDETAPFRLNYQTKLVVKHVSEFRSDRTVFDTILMLEAAWDHENIFHWYQDVATRLFSLCRRRILPPDVKIVFPNLQSLDSYRIGWLKASLQPCESATFAFADEFFTGPMCMRDVMFKSGLWWLRYGLSFPYDNKDGDWLRRNMWDSVGVGVEGMPLLAMNAVLLQRRSNRIIANEREVVDALKRKGFDTVVGDWTASTPLTTQVKAMRPASLFIGVHGAGLTNAALLPPCSTMIEIMPLYTGSPYKGIAEDSGVIYRTMIIESEAQFEFIGGFAGHCRKRFPEYKNMTSQECRLSRNMCIQCLLESSKLTIDLKQLNILLDKAVSDIQQANAMLRRGVSCSDVAPSEKTMELEVRSVTCKDAATQAILNEIIKESTERINRLQAQESANEVSLRRIQGDIEAESLKYDLVKLQEKVVAAEGSMRGGSEGKRVQTFLDELGEMAQEQKITLFNTIQRHDALTQLSGGNARLFFTPNDVNLRIDG